MGSLLAHTSRHRRRAGVKHRFISRPDGEPGLSCICAGRKATLHHDDERIRSISEQLRVGAAPGEVKQAYAGTEVRRSHNDSWSRRP